MSDVYCYRWISAWSRCDIPACPVDTVDACFTPGAFSKEPWNSALYGFDLPVAMLHQPALSPSEFAVYANPDLLPPGKRKFGHLELEHTLKCPTAHTVCFILHAASNHLDANQPSARGIFGCLVQRDKQVCYVDPPQWISFLGATEKLVLPSKLASTFKIVGNAVAVPHALLAHVGAAHRFSIHPSETAFFQCRASSLLERSSHIKVPLFKVQVPQGST